MSKRKQRIPKSGPVWRKSAEEATLAKMPKYNAHACGTGPHGDAKYNRAKQKEAWRRETRNEDARSRGRLRFTGYDWGCLLERRPSASLLQLHVPEILEAIDALA